jgi:Xaa-Pro aminopeptidase
MNISKKEYERRYAAIREQMRLSEMKAILVYGVADDFNRGNIRYLTGSGRGGCCILPLEGKPVFLISPMQTASQIRKMIDGRELLELKEAADTAEAVKRELSGLAKSGRIGVVGMGCISVPLYLALSEMFKDRWVDATPIFEKLRSIKSAEEIEKIRQSAKIADNVFTMLRSSIKPGMTDFAAYGLVKKMIYESGCEYSFDLIDAEGGRMGMTFYPTGEVLKANSTLFMEITPAFDGYYGQLPVTLPVGQYPAGIKKMIGVWSQANQAALKMLRPNVKAADVCRTMLNIVRENGYVSPLRPGHSIGLDALDFWSITETSDVILKAGMTIAVHPCIMTEFGGEACGMGYTYLITETGAERFSKIDLSVT